MLRVFVLIAGMALLMLPRIASALPPTALAAPPRAPGPAIVLAQAQPDAPVANPTIAWAQARLSEIDAAIMTLDVATRALATDARKRADAALATLRASQADFRASIEAIVADRRKTTEAQLADARATLESKWSDFERDLDSYLSSTDAGVALRKAVIEAREKAEEVYWQQAITALKNAEATVAAERRPAIDAAIAALQSYADAAKAKLAKLQQAGSDAWAAFQDGLADARRAFDKAYDGVQGAIERARQ